MPYDPTFEERAAMRDVLPRLGPVFQKNGANMANWTEAQALELVEAVIVSWRDVMIETYDEPPF